MKQLTKFFILWIFVNIVIISITEFVKIFIYEKGKYLVHPYEFRNMELIACNIIFLIIFIIYSKK